MDTEKIIRKSFQEVFEACEKSFMDLWTRGLDHCLDSYHLLKRKKYKEAKISLTNYLKSELERISSYKEYVNKQDTNYPYSQAIKEYINKTVDELIKKLEADWEGKLK